MSEQWIYGVHAVQALLENPLRKVHAIYIDANRKDARMRAILALVEARNLQSQPLSAVVKRFADKAHQGVVAKAAAIQEYQEADIPMLLEKERSKPLVLVLDAITDVHNFGACLRSADAAAVTMVIVPKDKSAPLNETVSKIACGAAENVPVVRATNLARALKRLQEAGLWIYGAAGEAEASLYTIDCRGPMAIVMGAEEKGLRRLTREGCDGLFHLPMHGTVESLNVSVATGVSLFEVLRQRNT